MKIHILLVLLFGFVLGGFAQVKTTENTLLYDNASTSSEHQGIIYEGTPVILLEKVGDFYKVTIKGKTGFIHMTHLSNYVKPREEAAVAHIEAKPDQFKRNSYGISFVTPGDDLMKAGNLALGGALITGLGSAVMVAGFFSDDLSLIAGTSIVGYGAAIVGMIMELVAWGRLKQAGEKMNRLGIGMPEQGIGLSFNLGK